MKKLITALVISLATLTASAGVPGVLEPFHAITVCDGITATALDSNGIETGMPVATTQGPNSQQGFQMTNLPGQPTAVCWVIKGCGKTLGYIQKISAVYSWSDTKPVKGTQP